MPTAGYILGAASDESAPLSEYWNGAGSFISELSNAQFFTAANNSIAAMRVEEGALQQSQSSVDVRLTNATQALTLAADSDSAGGWIYASAPSETAAVDSYYDGTGFVSELDSADFLAKAEGATLISARQEEGRFQALYTDRDIRLLPANAVITVV